MMNPNQAEMNVEYMIEDEPNPPYNIYRQENTDFTEMQKNMGRVFYWAGFYGRKALCQKFMKYLGVSPFAKMNRGMNLATACVKGN